MSLPTIDNVRRPRSQGYNARLNELIVRLVENNEHPLNIQTAEAQPPSINTNENPEDFSPTKGRVFSRSGFYGGEGLAFAHRPTNTELDRTRYWDSDCINIEREDISDIPSIKLSHHLKQQDDITNTNSIIAASPSTVWMLSGSDIKFTTDPFDTPPTWTTENPTLGHAGNLVSLALLNDDPYIAISGDGIHRRVAGVWAHWSDQSASDIFSVKERIFGFSSQNLYEIRAGAGSVLIHSLESNKRWCDITSVGPAILATASDGNVYTFTFETDEDTFDLVLFSRTKIEGENPRAITALHEEILLTTSTTNAVGGTIGRLYRCKLTQTLTLERQLVKEWGNNQSTRYNFATASQAKFSYATDRSSFYFNIVENTSGTDYKVSVWRYNLIENALSRYTSIDFAALADRPQFRGVIRFKGKTFFTMYSDAGLLSDVQGFWWESDEYCSEGYLITPLADFFTAVEKVWVSINVDGLSQSANETIEIYYTNTPSAITDPDSSDWHLLTEIIGVNLTEELRVRATRGRYLAMMIKLKSSNNTDTPELFSIAAQGYNGKSDFVINLPISVSDIVRRPGKRRKRAKNLGRSLHDRLISMQGEDIELEVYDPPLLVLGALEAVSERATVQYVKGFPIQVAYVTVVGKLLSDTSNLTGENVMGIGIMGIEIMGGVDD